MSATDQDPAEELVQGKAFDLRLFLRLMEWARPHAWQFVVSLLVLVGLFAAQLGGAWLWRLTLDGPLEAFHDGRLPRAEALRELYRYVAAYAGIVLAYSWLSYFEIAQLGRAGQVVVHDLRSALFEHMLRLDLTWFDARPTGSLVTRVTSDVENLAELFTSGLVVLVFDLAKVVVLIVLLFWLDRELALVVTAFTPVLIGVSLLFRGGARRGFREVRAHLAKLNGYLQEVLSGVRVVQMFHREERVGARFAGLVEPYLAANLRTLVLFALFFPAIGLTVLAIQGASLWFGGHSLATGDLAYGEFVQFWFYLAMLVDPIRDLGERFNVLQAAFASAERVFRILDTRPAIAAPEGPAPVPPRGGDLVFEDVGFAYVPGQPVLEELSFRIDAGETVALVGATGAGKSTIVNLALRFHDPDVGRVTLDGVDLRRFAPPALRARSGLVLQEDFLFEGTVRENLLMGRAGIDDAALERALDASCARDVVARLDGGLDARLTERGATLSTGERQLLAIARALAGDPELILLDEATANVDSATEARIEQATKNLLRGRSALVVAHRLSTVRGADRILVLHRGRLREAGTHAELLARGGLYARLYALQFDDAEA
ncbi:MAG: ABC transporter ATP-binding protein [Planctomycetes bacterium]|nr:ABC transporter ATP-binding protein [Planctomycetota bacterium]